VSALGLELWSQEVEQELSALAQELWSQEMAQELWADGVVALEVNPH